MNPTTMEALFTLLTSIHPLSEGLVNHLAKTLRTKSISKKQYLLKAGHTSRQICFIEKGLLRCFYEQGEAEVSSWFMQRGKVYFIYSEVIEHIRETRPRKYFELATE